MGEYADLNGERIKIGTCENMYYLRADQRFQVRSLPGNVDPVKDAHEIRFRFPFPDEDHMAPGSFDPYNRRLAAPGIPVVTSFDHYSVQFAHGGYLVSLPCPVLVTTGFVEHKRPEEQAGEPIVRAAYRIHRNGVVDGVAFGQQRLHDDGVTWMLIGECPGCGVAWAYDTWEGVEPVVVACRREADRVHFWSAVADRIAAGYHRPTESVGSEAGGVTTNPGG